jgi:hypothetical protein
MLAYNQRPHNKAKKAAYNREYRSRPGAKERIVAAQTVSRRRRRQRLIEWLGGKCAVCGEVDVRCLQIDHINGGGRRERQRVGLDQAATLRMVVAHPERFQVLCANHNCIKRWERGEGVSLRQLPATKPVARRRDWPAPRPATA